MPASVGAAGRWLTASSSRYYPRMNNFGASFTGAAGALLERLAALLPSLIGALLLLAAGWLLARLLRVLTVRGMHLAETLIERLAGSSRLKVGRSPNVLGTVVYWVVLLFFVTAATQVLGLQTFTEWLARLAGHPPHVARGAPGGGAR